MSQKRPEHLQIAGPDRGQMQDASSRHNEDIHRDNARRPNRHRLESLFDTHHAAVYRTALRITGAPGDAEDVLQTIFLRLARNPALSEEMPNPAAWFHRAAVNGALDMLRRKEIRLVKKEEAPSPHAQPLSFPQTGQDELEDKLRRALSELPRRWAEMFLLRFVEERTNKEIAQMFGTSPSVVAVTLYRARRDLREILARDT